MTRLSRLLTMPVLLSAAFGLLSACASKPEVKSPVATGPGGSFTEQHPTVSQKEPHPAITTIHISEDIARACSISDPDSYFAFDSARLNGDDTRVLNQLATCFESGPLAGRTMKLVGRADPRGTAEYNMTLGQHRADSVVKYLDSHGLAKAKMESTSRGKLDAVGTDEPTWAHDRRVDILLD